MARTAPVPNIPPIPGMCPSVAVAGGGSDSGGSGGQGAGSGGGGGPGKGGGAADGTGGDGKAAPDPKKYPLCGTKSHPVDVVTGRAFTHPIVDFETAGPIPFVFERSASSTIFARDFGMGPSWAHTLGWQIELRRDAVWVFTDKGTKIAFPLIAVGDEVLGPFGWRLKLDQVGYEVDADDGLYRRFDVVRNYRAPLTEIRDRNDNRISLSYDAKGFLQLVTDSGGRQIRVQCDDRGHILVFLVQKNPGEWMRLAEYAYDADGRLIRAADADGHAHYYAYNERNQLTLDQDRAGLRFHFRFDAEGRCIESWGDYGEKPDPSLAEGLPEFLHDGVTRCKGIHHCVFAWGEDGLCVVTDSTQSSNFFGNQFGLIDKMVEGGVTTTATYREDGHLTSVTDGMGAQTTYHRDLRGRVVGITDAIGRTSTFERDGFGLPTKIVDSGGGETVFSRDHRGNLVWARDPEGGLTQYERDARGLATKTSDPNNGRTEFRWDAQGNLESLTAANGATWRFSSDALGRRTSETNPLGHVSQYSHSARGDLVSILDSLGHVRQFGYDGERQLTSILTPEGHTTSFIWGGYHKLSGRTDSNGHQVRLGYNSEGELTHVWNEKGELHRLSYSPGGALSGERTFDGRELAYKYDKQGRPTSIRNGALEVTEFTYDLVGQLIGRKLHDESEEIYEYSSSGEIIGVNAPGTSIRFDRDRCGRVIREIQALRGVEHSVEVKYDLGGVRVARKTSLGHTEEVTRDRVGARQSTYLDGQMVRHATDVLGRETSRELSRGGVIESKFDPIGRLEERSVFGAPRDVVPLAAQPEWVGERRANTTAHKSFRYSPDGELVVANDSKRGRTEFRYDPVGQLLSMVPERAKAELFRYDPNGNLFETNPGASTRVYAEGNRLIRRGDTEYQWDDEGRLIEKRHVGTSPGGGGAWRYRWNAAGLMSAAERDDGLKVGFTYDAFARRLEKTVYRQPTTAQTPELQSKTRFVWDGDVLVHELRATSLKSGDAIVEEKTFWFEDSAFEPQAHKEVRRVDGVEETSSWFHYLNDPGGTPDRLVDEQGEIAAEYHRGSWGKLESSPGASASTPLRLQGQYWDEETGLAYNRWRYYDGEGRFCSADPTRIGGGLNLFAFAPNATGWADPLGLITKSAIPAANWNRLQGLPSGPGIYVLEGNGVKYVGSADDLKGRLCDQKHTKAENILKDPNAKISFHPVTTNPNDPGHSLKVAEQQIMNKHNIVPEWGSDTKNSIPALGPEKFKTYGDAAKLGPTPLKVGRKKSL